MVLAFLLQQKRFWLFVLRLLLISGGKHFGQVRPNRDPRIHLSWSKSWNGSTPSWPHTSRKIRRSGKDYINQTNCIIVSTNSRSRMSDKGPSIKVMSRTFQRPISALCFGVDKDSVWSYFQYLVVSLIKDSTQYIFYLELTYISRE